jgi:tetratricopeptide (TPR) repeat protein
MKKERVVRLGISLLAIVILSACASGQKQYDKGIQLSETGKYNEAIASLEQAIAAEPENEKYQQALLEAKSSLIKDFVSQGDHILNSEKPLSIGAIKRAESKLSRAKEIDPQHPAAMGLERRIRDMEASLRAKVQDHYSNAKTYMQQEKWLNAHSELLNLQKIFPDYEDSGSLMVQVSDKGANAFYEQGKALFDQEDYRGAKESLRQALAFNANHRPSKELLALAQERDNKTYFVEQGEKAIMERRWEQAIQALTRALEYDPEDQAIIKVLDGARKEAVLFFIIEARDQLYNGWIYKAFGGYQRVLRHATDSDNKEIIRLRKGILSKAEELAHQLEESGRFGSAWYWYTQIKQLDPGYPDIFFHIQAMEDTIIQRIKKSIAIFDFASPSSAPDAGPIFANNLSTFLFKSANKDVKILERENLKSILEEMKLGQIGIVSSQTAKEMGRVYGIDVAVMGSVLRYNVDSTSYSDTKSVIYQVKKTEENIEFLNWKAKHPHPTEEQLKQSPAPYIEKSVDVEKEYNVSTHKKVAFVTVSFRIVDVDTGENILVDTIPRIKVATDETSAGVQIAGIKYDPLEIPTDTQLLQELTEEVVSELGREGLKPLKDLEKTYFQLGEMSLRRRDIFQSVEHFTNAIFDEKVKMIQGSPITEKALQHLETIFKNYQSKT